MTVTLSEPGIDMLIIITFSLNLLEELKEYRVLGCAALLLQCLAEVLQSDASTICPQVRNETVFRYFNPLIHQVEQVVMVCSDDGPV